MTVAARRFRDGSLNVLAAYPVVVALLAIINVFAPQRSGALALTQIFAPHLLIPVLALVPVALGWGTRALRIAIGVALAVGVLRFGPGFVSIPVAQPLPDEAMVRVMSWNLAGGASTDADIAAVLRAFDADLVALQELTPEHVVSIRADEILMSRYPFSALIPRGGSDGIGVLSRFPISHATDELNPAFQVVELRLPGGALTLINAHAFAPRFGAGQGPSMALGFDPAERDREIRVIREAIDEELAAGRRFVVLGDFNVTDREPAFEDLSRGLWDGHFEAGQGAGSTWRPNEMAFIPFGVLRIDHLLGGPGTRPIWVGADCTSTLSDHCVLNGTVAVD